MTTAEVKGLNFFEDPLAGVEPVLLDDLGSELSAGATATSFYPAVGPLAQHLSRKSVLGLEKSAFVSKRDHFKLSNQALSSDSELPSPGRVAQVLEFP